MSYNYTVSGLSDSFYEVLKQSTKVMSTGDMVGMGMKQFLLIERGSPELFLGGKVPDVLFLGQDPTIVSPRHIPVVLDLANPAGQLHKYIFGKVCAGLNIHKSRVLAWNLVNRYFIDKPRKLAADSEVEADLNHRFPKLWGDKGDWKTVRFLYYYFAEFGKQELDYIVDKYVPLVLVSLGEPVFRVLRYAYALPQGTAMPENLADFCCKLTFRIRVGQEEMLWLALPHEPTGDRNPHYKRVLADELPGVGQHLAVELKSKA